MPWRRVPLLDPSPCPAPCSCAPFAASGPTASSSPGPGSQAPPHLQSPGSLLRTRDLRTTGVGGKMQDTGGGVWSEKVLLTPRRLGTRPGTSRKAPTTGGCFSKCGHRSATSGGAEAVQRQDCQPRSQEPCILALTLPLPSCAVSAKPWRLSEPQVCHLASGENNATRTQMCPRCLGQSWACIRCSIKYLSNEWMDKYTF